MLNIFVECIAYESITINTFIGYFYFVIFTRIISTSYTGEFITRITKYNLARYLRTILKASKFRKSRKLRY